VRDVNETDERGRTLLYVACRKGDARFARRALELSSGDTVNFTNVAGKHALYAAAAGGDEHVVELVIKAGAALEKKDRQGRSPLWAACYHLRPSAVARLLCLGADPSARDGDGTTPLIAAAAAEGGGGERNARGEKRAALERRARETVTAALTFSDPDALDLEHREWLTGCTALWAACASGSVGVALELIAAGADVDARNAHGRTPLLAAALGGHCEIALALVAAGADIDAADDEGETPLYAAAFENHPATVAALVAAGADVDGGEPETKPASSGSFDEKRLAEGDEENDAAAGNVSSSRETRTRAGLTPEEKETPSPKRFAGRHPPLVGACWRGNAAAVAAMLADGPGRRPDLERVTSDGRTALAASCWRGNHACARLLLAAGAEVDHADADGRTALWAAARAGDATSVRLCVERGGDVDRKDARREAFSAGAGVATCTPLFAAVWQEEHDAVRALLDAGADPRAGDGEGRAPLSLVDRGSADHTENTRRIREMLLDAVAKVEKSEKAAAAAQRLGEAADGARESALARATRVARLERADAQARVAAAWVEKREARARAAALPSRDDLSDDDPDDDSEDAEASDSNETHHHSSEASETHHSRRASIVARRRVALGARRVARALAAFRDASRAARDAERRSTVTLRPADVAGADAAAAHGGAPPRNSAAKLSSAKQSGKRSGNARRAFPGDKDKTLSDKTLSPSEVSLLVARADEARIKVRRLLHLRAREIRSSLADLPDALARLDERAAPHVCPRGSSLAKKSSVAARLSAAASPRGSRGSRVSFTKRLNGSFLDVDEADADDGWSGRGRYDSRATMAVLGSE